MNKPPTDHPIESPIEDRTVVGSIMIMTMILIGIANLGFLKKTQINHSQKGALVKDQEVIITNSLEMIHNIVDRVIDYLQVTRIEGIHTNIIRIKGRISTSLMISLLITARLKTMVKFYLCILSYTKKVELSLRNNLNQKQMSIVKDMTTIHLNLWIKEYDKRLSKGKIVRGQMV